MNHHWFTRNFAIIILCIGLLFPMAQCRKKSDPARLLINVDGKLFSNAIVMIDGRQAGKMVQTLIQPDGQLFIDGKYTVTLPAGHRDIPDDDKYAGALDSLKVEPGKHVIILQNDYGYSLQVSVNLLHALNTISYNSDDNTLQWNNVKITANPGQAVDLK